MSTPQQNFILGTQGRPAAKRLASTYFFLKSLQAIAAAETWLTVFPADNAVIDDGSSADGRPSVTDTQFRNLISVAGTFITYMETGNPSPLTTCLQIAVNPEQV
jgi:hypothetical protein